MKADTPVIQRCHASRGAAREPGIGEGGRRDLPGRSATGLLVLLGVAQEDSEADADYLAEKIAGLADL